jgi:hypothetical protein
LTPQQQPTSLHSAMILFYLEVLAQYYLEPLKLVS